MLNAIKTVYYDRKGVPLKVNRSRHANRAVATCVMHMQVNHYGATAAEVYDEETGELHAAMKRKIREGKANLDIVFERNPQDFHAPGQYALGFLFNEMK